MSITAISTSTNKHLGLAAAALSKDLRWYRSWCGLTRLDRLVRLDARERKKVVYQFDQVGSTTLNSALLGGKGAGLASLTAMGMPVPPGATITTQVGQELDESGQLPKQLAEQLASALHSIEKATGLRLGCRAHPLLLSVRSGAPVSMPGMMDTVLNVGLNEETLAGLAGRFDARFAWDSYRRFLAMFGSIVMGVDRALFEERLSQARDDEGVSDDCQLSVEMLRCVCSSFKDIIEDTDGRPVPSDPLEQITMAIMAVLDSWQSPRARAYRKSENIPASFNTAVNIQAMVFGNSGVNSGTGVVFSRNPSTAAQSMYGEYLANAQGEDVVAGVRTPLSLDILQETLPQIYEQLGRAVSILEQRARDIVEVEFTVERGRLYLLQWRPAKRTAEASAIFAVDQVETGAMSKEEAIQQVSYRDRSALKKIRFLPAALKSARKDGTKILLSGYGASPGPAVGEVTFSSERALELAAKNIAAILVRADTTPADLAGMLAARAIVTANGGSTCHAAVVARGKGIPAVVGCRFRPVNEGRAIAPNGAAIEEGMIVSVDGASGSVILGALPFEESQNCGKVEKFLGWLQEQSAYPHPKQICADKLKGSWCLNDWLADFYLSELMKELSSGQDEGISETACKLCDQVQETLASIFTCYIAYATVSELSYYRYDKAHREWDALGRDFGVCRDIGHQDSEAVVAMLERKTAEEAGEFFHLAAKVFDDPGWSCGFGGKKWAAIARVARDFMKGRLPRAVFIDHVFDLRHNGNCMFNKHNMVASLTCESKLHEQLGCKKQTDELSDLYRALNARGSASNEVRALYKEGRAEGLWS